MSKLQLDTGVDADWWRGAVIYQIYPRSFQDSNDDGIGDLAGIVTRLPHIASLGVDAIWISPFFASPMQDFGYDVSNYCDVDPMFGTLADFDAVIKRAHDLGLRVMIDLVLSHSSNEHPWFQQSQQSADNKYADWYVWADAKPDGTPPNNWLSVFGGSAWHWHGGRMQYYLHNFLPSQPDLNLHNQDVQTALLDVEEFWLRRGVDGFRLDTINFYFADKELRDNPALKPEDRNNSIAPAVNPYNWQEHIYSKNQPETLEFLKKFRALMEPYGAAAVGEVGDAQRGLEIMAEYTSGGDKVQMCYAFDLLQPARLTAQNAVDLLDKLARFAPDSWACWAYSNHDVMRHYSRWGLDDAAARAYATLLLCLRGSVCLYQGEEFSLSEAALKFEDLQDPYGIEFWPDFKGRDGCRTPIAWESSNMNGGFSGAKPWLPVAPEHLPRSAKAQAADPTALVHHYRRMIKLRAGLPALIKGSLTGQSASGDVLSFTRKQGDQELFCGFNLSANTAALTLPAGSWTWIETEANNAKTNSHGNVQLAPWQACIARRIEQSIEQGDGNG
ncbi:MAG: alpha glucosidase [Rhodobacteraceae bacterium]|nr:alpha glucosidase [Paracoccaceae bacterium]